MRVKLSNSYAAISQRKYRRKKLKNGLCVVAGCYNKLDSANYCRPCISKRKKYEKERILARKKRGDCSKCAKNKALPSIYLCLKCWWETKALQCTGTVKNAPKLKQLWENQGGKCALSGLPLIPGVNASVDHIVPKSKKGTNKISNLQWVLTAVNSFKLNYTVEEMIAICKAIISHHKQRR